MFLTNLLKKSRKSISESTVLLAGPVRNASAQIENDFGRLLISFDQFKKVFCFVVESDSSDDTITKLEDFSKTIPNFSFISVGELSKKYPKRTDRIAYCRNLIIDAVANDSKYSVIDYVAMADMDGMNGLVTREKIAQCWEVDEPWDVITANQLGEYYDIWALSHPYWNPMDCWEQKRQLENILSDVAAHDIAIGSKQSPIDPRADLIEVDSAFGGLGIYTREALRKKGFRIFINPALINCNKVLGGEVEEVLLSKPKGSLKFVQKFGIFLFGKKRFNKYLKLLQIP